MKKEETKHQAPGTRHYDVLGIGNAIVDIIAPADDSFLAKQHLTKNTMALIDEARAEELYSLMGPATECSGGSAANTLAGIASLGGRAAFIGKVRDDQLGAIFRHDMQAIGVHFSTPAATGGPTTARSFIFVTPDGARTMNTFLGACTQVRENDVDEALIAQSSVLYIEGYLWDLPEAKSAIRKALGVAKKHGTKVAFTLSDMFCVERHRTEFLELVKQSNIVFANEHELKALYETGDLETALRSMRNACDIGAITRSEQGSLIITPRETFSIDAAPIEQIVDTTGAGDLYAAGFLYGFTQGMDLRKSGELASTCAAQIIQQLGARAQKPLNNLLVRSIS